MNKEEVIPYLVDARNEALWLQIEAYFDVQFEWATEGIYRVFTINKEATFYVPPGVYRRDSFTHELLHTLIVLHECYYGGSFKNIIWQSNVLKQIIDVGLAEHITNCIEHRMMLPIYLSMGFERSGFLMDYELNKAGSGVLAQLKKLYREQGCYNKSAIRSFIGKFFAFICDPNPDLNYTLELSALRSIDPVLYSVLDAYQRSFIGYDFANDTDSVYRDHNYQLYEGLKKWMTGKRFI